MLQIIENILYYSTIVSHVTFAVQTLKCYYRNHDMKNVVCFLLCSGVQLATVSGDTTTKIWDFARAECIHTFTDHQKPGIYHR